VFANFNDDNDNGRSDWYDDTASNDPDLVPVDFYFPAGAPHYEAALDFSGGYYGPPFKLWSDASKSQLVFNGSWTTFAWDQVPGLVAPGHAGCTWRPAASPGPPTTW
jgi:hypothetical protein